ncbi:MAG: antibiotic biosynthesis monooxygenase [Oscillospiraceae bacterium]|nr:antibiotic biosynthesis monooxygenase [Oscillospiraceae bacterium]
MITDLMKFTIKEGCITEAIEVMKNQMKNNLGDDGCLMSNVFRSNTAPNEIFLLLGWENQESIDKHLASSHDLKFREDLDPLLAGPPEFYDWEKLA